MLLWLILFLQLSIIYEVHAKGLRLLNLERLGAEIKKWRKTRKLTQIQLAKGICHQSEISRLEKGVSSPTTETLQAISLRLRLPVSYFFEVLIHDDVENMDGIIEELRELSYNKDYEGIRRHTEDLLSGDEILHPEVRHYLRFHQLVSLYYIGVYDARYCISELHSLISDDLKGVDLLLNYRIKTAIATIHAEQKNYNKAIKIMEEILDDKVASEEYERTTVTILYNLGKMKFMQGDYEGCLETTEEGIRISKKLRAMATLGQLYYQKASALEQLEAPCSEISENYKKAMFYFDELNLTLYQDILQKNKSKYIIG